MLDIVVYLLDQQYREEISEALKERDYVFYFADNSKDVIRICKQEFIDLLLVWPASTNSIEDLLTLLNSYQLSHLPVIPVVQAQTDLPLMMQLPVSGVISVPLPRQEFYTLLAQISHNLRGASRLLQGRYWQGRLEEFALIDLMQMVEMSSKDAMATISYKGHTGQIYFKQGEIIRATLRNLEGLDALRKMSFLTHAKFQVSFTPIEPEYSMGMDNAEIFEQLKKHLKLQQKFLGTLPDFRVDLKSVTKKVKAELSDIKKQILELCHNGESIYELLIIMNTDNVEILRNMEELLGEGLLVRSSEYQLLNYEKTNRKGFASWLGNFTGFLKKESKTPESVRNSEVKTEEVEQEPPEILFERVDIGRDEIEKFEKFLEEI